MLFTLLIDDDNQNGLSDTFIWNIYYHLFLDPQSLEVLQNQAKKLHAHGTSIQSWHGSKYGKILRFCDKGTLAKITKIWRSYDTSGLTEDEKTDYGKLFNLDVQKALKKKEASLGSGVVLTGFRSAAPVGIRAMDDLPELHQHFWDHGITDKDSSVLSEAKHPNPMFASVVTDAFTLHYGTDPLFGFHLATAYTPLISGSPLQPKPPGKPHIHKTVEAARVQFQTWADYFKKRTWSNLTLRFFAGDALAFCHTLRQRGINKDVASAHWYRNSYHLEPLVLDGEDYATLGSAPLSFNVIDTSNLVDHLGALNVVVATSPLLMNNLSSSLYTESLVKKEESQKELMDKFFCGHLPTLSILLGLFPVTYWTAATTISSVDEGFMDWATARRKEDNRGQMRSRLVWKRSIPECIREKIAERTTGFQAHDLAHILYQVYQEMFQHEDPTKFISKPDLLTIQKNSCPNYHRGSFVSFLFLIKGKVKVEWNKMMETLLDLIKDDQVIVLGTNYFQELILQLRLFGVYSTSRFSEPLSKPSRGSDLEGISAWKGLPEFVCITMKIPRAKLGVFTSIPPIEMGTPILHCTIQSVGTFANRWQSIFAAIQLTFGEITTSGSRYTDDFKIHVAEDEQGWTGTSPLIVSFYAPTWMVLREPQQATISFGIQATPQAGRTFVKTLGFDMSVHTTTLGDEENVYISKYRPHQSGHPSMCDPPGTEIKAQGSLTEHTRTDITANLDPKTTNIVGFTGRLSFLSEDTRSILKGRAPITVVQVSPCILDLFIGKGNPRYRIYFPAPVLQSQSITRIARKSSYVEIEAPILGPIGEEGFPHFMYPLFLDEYKPVIWNMPYLNLDCLPILDVSKPGDLQWLVTHTSLQFSTRERASRDKSMESSEVVQKDVRINFKDSLFTLFMHFTGAQGSKSHVFGLSNPAAGGVHVLLFVSCLRLELANHTVVLDAAVLPLTSQLMPRIRPFFQAIKGMEIRIIYVDDDELKLWKEVLPAMVERCRQWEHRPSCEYKSKGQIPLSVENGESVLCSCGNETLPPRFISGVPKWDMVSRYAVRAAISPSFSVPFIEENPMSDEMEKRIAQIESACLNCGTEKSVSGGNLLKCSRCFSAKYCSVECQRANWKEHKKVCKK